MKCSRTDCNAEATFIPCVSFTALGHPNSPRAQIKLGLPLCAEHALPAVDKFIDEQGWQQLTQVMKGAGRASPDPASAVVDFVPIPEKFADGAAVWSADIEATKGVQ